MLPSHVPESFLKGQVEQKRLVLVGIQNNRCSAKFLSNLRREGVMKNKRHNEFLQNTKINMSNIWHTINLYVGDRGSWRTIRYILWYIYIYIYILSLGLSGHSLVFVCQNYEIERGRGAGAGGKAGI